MHNCTRISLQHRECGQHIAVKHSFNDADVIIRESDFKTEKTQKRLSSKAPAFPAIVSLTETCSDFGRVSA